MVWDARLALARLWQVYRRVIQAPSLPDGFRWRSAPMPAVVKELARDAGIRIGPRPNRVVTTCPSCGAEVYLLRATATGWGCRRCLRGRWRQLEVSAGSYAMGVFIGLTGRPMIRRRRRLARSLWFRAARARSLLDVLFRGSVGAAAVLEYSPHWRRRPGGTRAPGTQPGPGPLMAALGPLYVQVVAQELLHPRAFRQRFASG